jgi:hypothetical protein
MPSPNEFPIDLSLLGAYSVLPGTPSWEQVDTALKRLSELRNTEVPYEEMEQDRDSVLQYALILQRCSQTIASAVCLTTHLARFSPAATTNLSAKYSGALTALSTGLDLRSLDETGTQSELLRCMRELFNSGSMPDIPALPQNPPPEALDTWRASLDQALQSVRDLKRPDSKEVQDGAWFAWQERLLAFAEGRPDVPPDLNYLCCRTEGTRPGTILRARLHNLLVREWSDAYIDALAAGSASPLWFGFGALAGLGFDLARDLQNFLTSSGLSDEETSSTQKFLSRIELSQPPKKGLIVIRLNANSVTYNWSASNRPALVVTSEQYFGRAKIDLRPYFQSRLDAIMIEVAAAEKPEDALKRVPVKEIQSRLPNVPVMLLLAQPPQPTSPIPPGYGYAVNPNSAGQAHWQVFPSGA